MKYICNPMNIEYKYQFVEARTGLEILREAADPSMVLFEGKYYLFPSMAAGFFTSDDLVSWEHHPLCDIPVYDYAPDVRVVGDYLYFSASNAQNGSFYRSKDPIHGNFEEIKGTFPFWDPNLFADDDGRLYFYWGCSNVTPIYGVELNPEGMTPIGGPVGLVTVNDKDHGYERNGENHIPVETEEETEAKISHYLANNPGIPEEHHEVVRRYMQPTPFLEGPWMDKYEGKYYLQYAIPNTEYNVYGDGVYVSDNPLGPFEPAKNNPYSYKPGGFVTGAGHGSTMKDRNGNIWHIASARVSVNSNFERRLGLWPAGFDEAGELFCNQRYGDWPVKAPDAALDPWAEPEWMLLSYGKPASASSCVDGKEPSKAVDENMQTWWRAARPDRGGWLEVDLEEIYDVSAIQINFADDKPDAQVPEETVMQGEPDRRYIDTRKHYTRWLLEGSVDGREYFVIADKSEAETDLSHDLVVVENVVKARYIRCTVKELPFDQTPCISGLRIFGRGIGEKPSMAADVQTDFATELDLHVKWTGRRATGHVVLWGYAPDKLYHSYMVYGQNEVTIGALIKGQPLYIRVDSFNENGITEGQVIPVRIFGEETV